MVESIVADSCNVFKLYNLLAAEKQSAALEEKKATGKNG